MSKFTRAELEYLQSQRRGRLATVTRRGEPQVKAVGFRYNAECDTIDIGGFEMEKSQKFRNITHNPSVSFLVDDVLLDGSPGFIEIRGYAQALPEGGQSLDPALSPALPCCQMPSSLNDLNYDWRAGFARFLMEARFPNGDLAPEQISLFASLLGCSMRKIWAHS